MPARAMQAGGLPGIEGLPKVFEIAAIERAEIAPANRTNCTGSKAAIT